MNIAICDDDLKFQDKIVNLVDDYFRGKSLDYKYDLFNDGDELLKSKHHIYDIVLLDITMPKLDGISTGEKIRESNIDTFIVFITQYVEYAVVGYGVNAFRYILKEDINKNFAICMDDVMRQIKSKKKRLQLKFVEGDVRFNLENLVFIESDKHKLVFTMYDMPSRQLSMYDKLDNLESMINDSSFLRIHKSYFVNMKYVTDFKRYEVKLLNNTVLPITKSRYPEVRQKYILYKG